MASRLRRRIPAILSGAGASAGVATVSAVGVGVTPTLEWTIADTPYTVPGTWYAQTAGQSYDVSQHVADVANVGVYSITTQTKNTVAGDYGFTIDADTGVISVPADLENPASTDSYAVTVNLAEAVTTTGDLPTLTVSSASGAWTFGQPIKKGAAQWIQGPAGTQVEIRNRWDDGTAKFAVISGVNVGSATLTAVSSNPYTAGHLSLTQMRAAVSGSITVGTQTVNLATLVAGTPQRTVATGPVMSNWIFRQALSVGTDLSLWMDVRYYSNGAVELFPWVENATLQTASPVNYVGTCSVTVGTTTSLGSIDFKARTRIPLLTGSGFAYWVGQAASLTPSHDTAYLKATKLVPNYGYTFTNFAGLIETYTPNTLAGVSTSMGAAGGEGSVNAPACAAYVASGDVRAYRAALTFGMSGGSWSIHLRDSGTQEPFRFSAFPNPAPAGSTGGTNGTEAYSHLPGFAFVPYLVTGRWWFLDEMLLWSCHVFTANSYRQGARAIADPTHGYTSRGAAWSLNTHAHALCLLPDSHPNRSDLIYAWEQNCAYYAAVFVNNTAWPTWDRNGTYWVSPHGFLGTYSSGSTSPYGDVGGLGAWWDAAFMQNYLVCVWGVTSDYELPVSAQAQADHVLVRNHGYKQVTGRSDSYNWRRFVAYDYAFGEDGVGMPCETWFDAATSYSKYITGKSLAALDMTEGTSLKAHSSETDLVNGSSSMPYGASALMGLALAREHGVTGAVDGYRRITTASNFAASFPPYFAGNVAFGVTPR